MKHDIRKTGEFLYEIPASGNMRVPGRIFADEEIIKDLSAESSSNSQFDALQQIKNTASLPGIVSASLAMPDVHPGYGFCIGGVAAFDTERGIISAAGVGFDCNCGVRMLTVPVLREELDQRTLEKAAGELFRTIPAGVGSEGKYRAGHEELDMLLSLGAQQLINQGFGLEDEADYIEENGRMKDADPGKVSSRAKDRQRSQTGTLGSGNHYLEIQYVDTIYDDEAAKTFGISRGQIVVCIHCGSRSLGHQIGQEHMEIIEKASRRLGIFSPAREVAGVPLNSKEGAEYYGALCCAVNCAFANRQYLAHLTRTSLSTVLGIAPDSIKTLYDVGHNNCKIETHTVGGRERRLIVHRKGATRAFGPGDPRIPKAYIKAGQPVIIGGTMGTASYLLTGTEKGMKETFGSGAHGAGRKLSRTAALKEYSGENIVRSLKEAGIIIKTRNPRGIAEEAPGAYKDIDRVAGVMHEAGINKKTAKMRPIVCIKG